MHPIHVPLLALHTNVGLTLALNRLALTTFYPSFPFARTGTPYAFDPHFNGPTKRRVKTDTSFLVLFGMFVAGWLLIGVWGKCGRSQLLLGLELECRC